MTDRELMRRVFPERVVRAVEREIEMRNAEENTHDSDSPSPDKDSLEHPKS